MTRAPAIFYSAVTLCAIAGLAVLYFVPPERIGYDVCFSRRVLHIYCAGCGATRATRALLHGDVAGAFRLNALYVLLVPVLLYAWFVAGQYVFRVKKPLPLFGWRGVMAILSVMILFTILRNILHF